MSDISNLDNKKPVRGGEGTYTGLCLTVTVFLGLAAIGTFVGSLIIKGVSGMTLSALTLIFALATITAWLSSHAARLRYRLVEASTWKPPQWGRAESSSDLENPYIIEFEQGRSIHFWLLGLIPTAIITLLGVYLFFELNKGTEEYFAHQTPHSTLLGIMGFVFSCIWLIFASSFETASSDDLPESSALSSTMRELLIISLVSGVVFIAKPWIGAGESWFTRILIIWAIIVGVELFARLLMGWINRSSKPTQFTSPIDLTSRNLIFVLGNPIAGLFNTLEKKYGISFRSSWAIRFVARATVPALLMVVLLSWALTSLSVVRLGEMGVRINCGVVSDEPLTPGLYFKLPWPLGEIKTYPVKQAVRLPIGFAHDEDAEHSGDELHAYLWTETHGEEFELLLGAGHETIVVNAMVVYKIREDKEGFMKYVFSCQNPKDAIEAYGYRALMEMTRSKTIKQVLEIDRNAFAMGIKDRLTSFCDKSDLGVEIIDVCLLNLHPPVDVAEDYLGVISAKINVKANMIKEEGQRDVKLLQAQMESYAEVVSAKIEANKRISAAQERSSEFLAVGEAYKESPQAFKNRYWLNTIEQSLANKRLVLIDKNLPLFWDMSQQPDKKKPSAMPGLIQAE
ncbi:MAG: hypothetical protein IJQ39_04175 [Thermoguttaceae bacterium]|nr:hypothetical protein [Thermoguttaceae bacterium]